LVLFLGLRILAKGANSFLGSQLCDRSILDGDEAFGVDSFFTGSRTNVSHLLANPSFELMRHDVTFPLFVEVDAIYDLVSPASPIHYQRDPFQTIKTNILGAVNMLALSKRLIIPIFQASTIEVY
jgi:UDP-glucuronate decarboxylase